MASNVTICSLDPSLKDKMKKFRFRKEKNNAAIMMKINKDDLTVVLEEEFEDCSLDELQEELPDHQPRYILYSYCYNHDDGRISYPLCFIFISPQGANPEQQMLYSGSKTNIVNQLQATKVFELRSVEEMTQEWLEEKLKFFR